MPQFLRSKWPHIALHYSHSKSVVLLFLWTLIRCAPHLASLITISQTVHCLLLVHTSLTITVSGLVCWGSWLTSYVLRAFRSLSSCLDVSQTFDSFSKYSKRWRICSCLLWHRRPDQDSWPRPVQMRHSYSVLAVKDCSLLGRVAMWSRR